MSRRNIIVVGASAGGVEALSMLARGLPRDLPAAVFVVLHLPGDARSTLPQILERAGPLPASHYASGTPIEHGRIYVAPPDWHLLVRSGYIEWRRGPKVHGHRPAVDVLFRSAAEAYGPQVIAVVLTGTLSDGTAGVLTVKAAGGLAVAQDPSDAFFPNMPESVIAHAGPDYVLPLSEIPALLARLAGQAVEVGGTAVAQDNAEQEEQVHQDLLAQERGERLGKPSVLTCPDCGGVLWELNSSEFPEYLCHVGHRYALETLEAQQAIKLEETLWMAIRALVEKAVLAERLATRSRQQNRNRAAEEFSRQARQATDAAGLLRRIAEDGPTKTIGADL